MSLRILAEISPDAWAGPDGTMIITTGMITAVNSEALDREEQKYSACRATGLRCSIILPRKRNGSPVHDGDNNGYRVREKKTVGE